MGNQSEMYDRLINNIMWYSLQRVWNAHDYTTLFFFVKVDEVEAEKNHRSSVLLRGTYTHNSQVKGDESIWFSIEKGSKW